MNQRMLGVTSPDFIVVSEKKKKERNKQKGN
jgi:hypothetical protein